ncbi:hypothetical protein [Alkaliphilus transvaalensis]|uniref:hypothetical protein n=1 Tax=Alkaliphilus transvaalensis TaxID=114628 RepID=UPI0012EC3ED1|nr:hypothetical protein [Alkaliphilus transvaalensis]
MTKTLENCIVCGKLFRSNEGVICQSCLEDKESPYQKVKDYLFFHRGASVFEVSEATGVEVKLILKYLKEGRITVL